MSKLVKFTPNLTAVKTTIGNQYLIANTHGIVLIDTGLRGNQHRILSAINSLGMRADQLSLILITHADGDHFGSLSTLQLNTPARTGASQLEAAAIRLGRSSRPLTPKTPVESWLFKLTAKLFYAQAAHVDTILEAGSTLPILGGLQVLDTAGHTPGHLSFYLPEEKILFAGDSIWRRDGKPSPSTGSNTWDPNLARQAFDRQMALPLKIIAAGHCVFLF
jgi:glyoxylase-like metal-dependent hydrolase (beta-lactamase superfamily II)